MVNKVSHVMKKWKAAKVSWASLREGSEKMALFVNTWKSLSVTETCEGVLHTQRTIPMVARVLTTIQVSDEAKVLFGGLGFSSCCGRSPSSSWSSPISKSSGDLSSSRSWSL